MVSFSNARPAKTINVELQTSLHQDDSLTEAIQTLPEAQGNFLYNEQLNREQLKLLDLSRSEIKYLALSIFVDPCIIEGSYHILIKTLSILLYFGQAGGYIFFTYGFIQNNFPMIGVYPLLTSGLLYRALLFGSLLYF